MAAIGSKVARSVRTRRPRHLNVDRYAGDGFEVPWRSDARIGPVDRERRRLSKGQLGIGYTLDAGTNVCTSDLGDVNEPNGAGPYFAGTRGTLATPLDPNVDYYLGSVAGAKFKLYTSRSDAIAGVNEVDFTDVGVNTQAILPLLTMPEMVAFLRRYRPEFLRDQPTFLTL
jgi:hypothetical protein